jgi:hypothetical protein
MRRDVEPVQAGQAVILMREGRGEDSVGDTPQGDMPLVVRGLSVSSPFQLC